METMKLREMIQEKRIKRDSLVQAYQDMRFMMNKEKKKKLNSSGKECVERVEVDKEDTQVLETLETSILEPGIQRVYMKMPRKSRSLERIQRNKDEMVRSRTVSPMNTSFREIKRQRQDDDKNGSDNRVNRFIMDKRILIHNEHVSLETDLTEEEDDRHDFVIEDLHNEDNESEKILDSDMSIELAEDLIQEIIGSALN